jgi:hypothetical protein
VGTWLETSEGSAGPPHYLEFSKDGHITSQMTVPTPNKGTLTTKTVQTYHLDGNTLTTKAVAVIRSTTDSTMQQKVDLFNQGIPKAIARVKPNSVELTWQDKDHFSFEISGMTDRAGKLIPPRTVYLSRAVKK